MACWGLLGLAQAHSPHDVATTLATDGVVVVAFMPRVQRTWVVVFDEGHPTFHLFPEERVLCSAFDGDELLVGTDGGGLWRSVDLLTWERVEGVGEEAVITDIAVAEDLVLAGGGRLFRRIEGGDWEESRRLDEDDITTLAIEDDRACLGTDTGRVLCSSDEGETWEELADLALTVLDLDLGPELWVGTDGGGLLREDDWSKNISDHEVVSALAVQGDTILASSPEAVWYSPDSGETWMAGTGLEAPQDGRGSPPNGLHHHEFVVHGETWLLASWEGVFRSEDGLDWAESHMTSQQTFWEVELARGEVWLPGYGEGGLSSIDLETGEVTWHTANRAMHPRGVEIGEDVILIPSRGRIWRDTPSWGEFSEDLGFDYVEDVALGPGDRTLIAGVAKDGVGLALWSEGFLPLEEQPPQVYGLVVGEDWFAASVGDEALIVSEGDSAFQTVQEGPVRFQPLVVDGDSLWAGSADGLFAGDIYTGLEVVDHAGFAVAAVEPLDDGRLLAALDEGLFVDGSLLATFDSTAVDMAEGEGWLAVATPTGAWVSDDAGESWLDASRRVRVSVISWAIDDEWRTWSDTPGHFETAYEALDRGSTASLAFEGSAVALRARQGDQAGKAEVRVDGGEWKLVDLAGPAGYGQVWCADVAPGEHLFEVRANTLPVLLEAVEITTNPRYGPDMVLAEALAAPLCVEDELDDERRCGCDSRPSPALLLAAACGIAVLSRRERRDLRSAPARP